MFTRMFFAAFGGPPDFETDPDYQAACRWADAQGRTDLKIDVDKIAALDQLAQQTFAHARSRCDLLAARALEVVKLSSGLATALIAAAVALRLTDSWAVRGSLLFFIAAAIASLGCQVAPRTASFPNFRASFEAMPELVNERLWLAVAWFKTIEGLRVHAEWLARKLNLATLLLVLGVAMLAGLLF